MPSTFTLVSLLFLVVWLYSVHLRWYRAKLPPGPRPLLFVGNLLDPPPLPEYSSKNRWRRKYGDIVHMELLGTPIAFIESGKVGLDLFSKSSALYSDRPRFVLAGDMIGMDKLVPLRRFGEDHKLDRKLINQALSATVVTRWRPTVAKGVNKLLLSLLETPRDFAAHFRSMAGYLIFMVVYGYEVQNDDDPYVHLAEELAQALSDAVGLEWIIEFLPILRHIPGLPSTNTAARYRPRMDEWINAPHRLFKELPGRGVTFDTDEKRNSLCGALLLSEDGRFIADADVEERVKWITASMYSAGMDTSITTLNQFVLVMVLFPEVQRRAQKEIDEVVGRFRLPTHDDRPRLPYIDCVFKEIIRWGTPVPLSVPHRLTRDDTYNGYHLPEGTLCNANFWSMLHNEDDYADPYIFDPDHFADKPGRTPEIDRYTYAFGFGRRRCPGMQFADQSVWLAMASVLACFDLAPELDKDGNALPPELAFESGTFRQPKPFECRITPRREEVLSMLRGGGSL